jgi:hypothetical protein
MNIIANSLISAKIAAQIAKSPGIPLALCASMVLPE